MTDYIRLKTAHGTYLKAWPDGRLTQGDGTGRGSKFLIEGGLEPWQPVPDPPPTPPLYLGNWSTNAWYPDWAYASWMYPFFAKERRDRYFQWLKERGFTHIISCASEADKWSRDEVTPRRFRWWESEANTAFMLDSLWTVFIYEGLLPLLTVFEHTSVPLADDVAIKRAQRLVDLTHQYVPLYILSWEIDERIPNSQERWRWEKMMAREINWRGRDLGYHYARPLEGSGKHVYGGIPDAPDPEDRIGLRQAFEHGGNAVNGANVVRLYQSDRNASIATLRDHGRLIGDVAKETRTKVAAFEHSGTDPTIGHTYTEADANERATVLYEAIRSQGVSAEDCGSMNGAAW